MKDWSEFNIFESVNEKYLPDRGEGETKATQIVTAVNKLIYKWYNDGDVYDNTYHLNGWANDLSDYANWLEKYANAGHILRRISVAWSGEEYEDILYDLACRYLDEDFLKKENEKAKVGTIYDCPGSFRFEEYEEDDEEEWMSEEDYWLDDDEEAEVV